MYNFSFFGQFFFLQTFLLYNWILLKKSDSKSKAYDLSNYVSFVIFGHQTWDLEGGRQIEPPPPAYPGFQVPQQ